MTKEDPKHFEVWLAAYESHLVRLKQGKAPVAKKPAETPSSQATTSIRKDS